MKEDYRTICLEPVRLLVL